MKTLHKAPVRLLSLSSTPHGVQASLGPKGFGYGQPVFLDYSSRGRRVTAVMETMKGDRFGHEYLADRAHNILLAHSTYANMPRHSPSLDAGIITRDHALKSVGDAEEYFQLVEFVKGKEYFHDLERIKKTTRLRRLDLERVQALADYLAQIHSEKHSEPSLYIRRIRELVGHGECIMGLTDSYPLDSEFVSAHQLEEIEKLCVSWRWKLKRMTARLSRVHGDFHPWNILFRSGTDFSVIDRSRGEWGEPADDVAAITINYVFFSLMASGEFCEPFLQMWNAFHSRYLLKTNDRELYSVIQPFYAWRGLVIASPIWYPNLTKRTRSTILSFIRNVLLAKEFDYRDISNLLSARGR